MKKQILTIMLKYGLGLAIMISMIWYYWHKDKDGEEVGISALVATISDGQRTIHWGPLTLALAISGACVVLTFFRWFILVRAQGLPFTPRNALRLGLAGFFWNTFLPGSVTGDIPKAYLLARGRSRQAVAVATVIVDRIVGFCALFWLVAFLGSAFWVSGILEQLVQNPTGQRTLEFIVIGSVGLVVGTLVFWIVLGIVSVEFAGRIAGRLENVPRIGHSLAELWRAVLMYRTRGKSILLALALAIVAHNGFVLTFYLCSLTLYSAKDIPSVGTHFLIVPVGMTVQAVFPTPGGMGGGELAFKSLYEAVGKAPSYGLMACIMQRALNFVLAGLAYFAWMLMKPTLPEPANEEIADRSIADCGVRIAECELRIADSNTSHGHL